MTKSFIGLAAALALGGLGAISSAQAAPLQAGSAALLAGSTPIETVAFGCGRGWTRGPYGRCRPMFRPRPFYGRRCFIRPTPYGPRRVCRF